MGEGHCLACMWSKGAINTIIIIRHHHPAMDDDDGDDDDPSRLTHNNNNNNHNRAIKVLLDRWGTNRINTGFISYMKGI